MDGSDPSCSNWLRFINCARNEEEQNMVAYQYHGEIYYRTFKAVYPGNELTVWYGEKYAEELGISVQYTGFHDNYECRNCGSSFVASKTFKLHLKHSSLCAARHPQIFTCGKCRQRFDELSQLQLHIRRHEAVQDSSNSIVIAQRNPFATDESKENIFIHFNYQLYNEVEKKSRKHTRFECEYCGKAFIKSGDLKKHLRTHTGDKPFKCEYCGKAFGQSSSLLYHLRTHTGDKPFKCKYCGKAFSQSGTLQRHLHTHTGDKPFKNHLCTHDHLNTTDISPVIDINIT